MPSTSAGTDASNVKNEIDTGLSDSDIEGTASDEGVLDLVERDIDREYGSNPGFDDDQHRQDFEAALAALRIATGNAPDAQDRTAEKITTGRTSRTYEESFVDTLRQRVRRRDPGSAFGHGSAVIRRDSRHTTDTT